MTIYADIFFKVVGIFFIIYLLVYATYLFASVVYGALNLYKFKNMRIIKNELKHSYYFPISIVVPSHNEEITIVDSIESLLQLDYKLYEVIIVDDGSTDNTSKKIIEHFNMNKVNKPIRKVLQCKEQKETYEVKHGNVQVTLIIKEQGGKGDALNMGINASAYPYFLCIDADSMLQKNSLEKIVQPVLENDNVVAVGGLIRIAQCAQWENGNVVRHHLANNPIVSMQVMEYERSFLASRILLDAFNGNLIISGAYGLFKKDIVIAVGGYDTNTLGEDMELVLKMHLFCRNNKMNYAIRYEPNAICWSQAPENLKGIRSQRTRWHLGLYQCMKKYRHIALNKKYGRLGYISYIYFLLYELFSPQIEFFGLITVLIASCMGILNWRYMIFFYILYLIYGSVITITAFFQRIYSDRIKLSKMDIIKVFILCILENVFFKVYLEFIRFTAFFGYKKKKKRWGVVERSDLKKKI